MILKSSYTIKLCSGVLKFSTPYINAANFFFSFQLNAHNTLNTHIYRQLPPTCFVVCYTIFRETTELLAHEAQVL